MTTKTDSPPRRKIFRGAVLPERPQFTLESASNPEHIEEFLCASSLPGMVAIQFAVEGFSATTLPTLWDTVILAEDRERFDTFCQNPDNGVSIELLVDIATYLLEEYTARPTEPSSTQSAT